MTKLTILSDIDDYRTHPDVRWKSRNLSVNMREYKLRFEVEGGEKTVTVYKGFEADGSTGSSVTGLIGIPADGHNRPAWLVHDYLYVTQKFSRKFTDDLFLEMLLKLGMGRTRSYAAYYAVRALGGLYWNTRKERPLNK